MNCGICGKPVILVPSAAERAKKFGNTPEYYIRMFPNHVGCELMLREKETKEMLENRKESEWITYLASSRSYPRS